MSSFISSPSESKESESISNTNPKKSYEVYLSFCSRDTGSFVSNLYTALSTDAGIHVFWDDKRLESEDRDLTPSMLNPIGESTTAIILFSRNYANSRRCLQELEKIIECCRTTGLIVLALFFFGSSPRGNLFGKAFNDFVPTILTAETSEKEDKFLSWVAEISKATKYRGHVVENSRNEIEDIREVVERVIHVLTARDLLDDDYPVGVKSRVQDVIQLLKQAKHPLLLGIWGMVEIGKTTIAKAIYDQIAPYFEDKSFVKNVRGASKQASLEERLRHKRVLLILDDVTNLEQLNAVCGSREWFGAGSKIIITTRNRHLLREHRVDHIYRVKELDQTESLQVFNLHAKKSTSHKEDFVELPRRLVSCSGGFHLALKVLGSYLSQRVPERQWMDVLSGPEKILISGVLNVLERSFSEDLNDKEKQIFLDIACFFIGMDKNDALYTLNRSAQSADPQISLLEDKSFVTIDENNKLGMHVLLQAMAREIITRESRNKPEPKTFDVFLSFRGGDSRAKFISHLYSSLQNSAIRVFKDDDEIQRGDQISFSLLRAIGRSRIFIVVLSTNYANSRWCMLELEKIMEIGRTWGVVVVPVFYEVHPSEVDKKTSEFGKAFEDLISKISLDESVEKKWRRDLFGIGGIAGFVIINPKNESADIKNIVERVTSLLDRTELFVAEHPVGVESRVQAVTKLLNIQKSKDVLLLGIWGMGGTGKTTIAKAIYNKIGKEFEGRSILLNISEEWKKDTDGAFLQQLVLCDIYKTTKLKIRDIESGKTILMERLAQKRVLVVLDDVSKLDQLKALCGSPKWFGPGSRIIITTRNKHLFRSRSVDHMVRIEDMNKSESIELFSWHAFKQATPVEDFAALSSDVIAYSGSLPLALEILGSFLSGRKIEEWQSVLMRLKKIPDDEVQKKLKISFDGLNNDTEKQIFLDIAFFFIGMDRNDVIQILNGCQLFADIGINVLLERSLVTVDNMNKLRMHGLLRNMGREIVRQESPFYPGKRSRLWLCVEDIDILSKHKVKQAVKGLALELPREKKFCLNTKAFEEMDELRLLQLTWVQLNGDFKYLSEDLRWLYWHGFPSTDMPAKFRQRSLVAIELKYSKLKHIWKKSQMLENLKILNLSHSQDLAETPDFSYLPNLEKLVLKDCPSLSKVSDTIGSLHQLLLINLTDCTGLPELPRSIYTLKSLETLILSGCSMIDKLEEDLGQMESLVSLIADRTAITKVPFSIEILKRIAYISLCGIEGSFRDVCHLITQSWMSPTNNVISLAQTSASMLSLASLDFLCGSSYSLPSAFKDFLRSLCAESGLELQLTQDVARILDALKATNCEKLEASASTSQISHTDASPLIDCRSPVHISRSRNNSKSHWIQMGKKCQVSYALKNIIFQTTDGTGGDSFLLPDDNNPDRLPFSSKGYLKFEVPKMEGHKLKKMTLEIVYSSSSDNITLEGCQGVLIMIRNYTKKNIKVYGIDTLTSFEDEQWQSITSNLEPGNEVAVKVFFVEGFIVEKTTIYLLYDKPIGDEQMEHFHAVAEEDAIVSGGDDALPLKEPLKSKQVNSRTPGAEEEEDDDDEDDGSLLQLKPPSKKTSKSLVQRPSTGKKQISTKQQPARSRRLTSTSQKESSKKKPTPTTYEAQPKKCKLVISSSPSVSPPQTETKTTSSKKGISEECTSKRPPSVKDVASLSTDKGSLDQQAVKVSDKPLQTTASPVVPSPNQDVPETHPVQTVKHSSPMDIDTVQPTHQTESPPLTSPPRNDIMPVEEPIHAPQVLEKAALTANPVSQDTNTEKGDTEVDELIYLLSGSRSKTSPLSTCSSTLHGDDFNEKITKLFEELKGFFKYSFDDFYLDEGIRGKLIHVVKEIHSYHKRLPPLRRGMFNVVYEFTEDLSSKLPELDIGIPPFQQVDKEKEALLNRLITLKSNMAALANKDAPNQAKRLELEQTIIRLESELETAKAQLHEVTIASASNFEELKVLNQQLRTSAVEAKAIMPKLEGLEVNYVNAVATKEGLVKAWEDIKKILF